MKCLIQISLLALGSLTSAIPALERRSPSLAPLPDRKVAIAQALPLQPRNATGAVGVARAGGVLNPQAAAEANVRDDTATRAFSSASIKSAEGQCLFIDPTAGDFRENLIPVQLKACDGSANEKFDILTKGKHNDQAGSMLVVSTKVCNL